MKFMETSEDADPGIINKFLKSIEQFENAWENAESKKVVEILEHPEFK